jgi:alcohol dehydrogenase (cytochrome c)
MRIIVGLLLATAVVSAQQSGLDPATMLKPLSDSWPTYSGDYTGRRYSALTQINQSNVKNLSLAWTTRLAAGPGGPAAAAPFGPIQPQVITGGVGDNEFVGGTT